MVLLEGHHIMEVEINESTKFEYGIRNRPPVRNFRPLYASKKSTKCENNRPIV